MLTGVRQLTYCICNHLEELILPYGVEFIHLLVSLYTIAGEVIDKSERCFGVLLCQHPCGFGCSMTVLFGLFSVCCFLWLRCLRGENVRGREDLIKVLELLPCLKSVRVANYATIYLCHVGEPINDKGTNEDCIRDFVIFNSQTI